MLSPNLEGAMPPFLRTLNRPCIYILYSSMLIRGVLFGMLMMMAVEKGNVVTGGAAARL